MNKTELLQIAKPIIFNTDMVRAILDGRKTVTRRLVKPQHLKVLDSPYHKAHPEASDDVLIKKLCEPSYHPGDILYVRETWGIYNRYWFEADYFMYKADYPDKSSTYATGDGIVCDLPKWHPSIHMPKEAARIFLRVTDVRVERLQDIADEQAEKEGSCDYTSTALGFCYIWDSTIPKKGLNKYGWDANPWVWVIEFERVEAEA